MIDSFTHWGKNLWSEGLEALIDSSFYGDHVIWIEKILKLDPDLDRRRETELPVLRYVELRKSFLKRIWVNLNFYIFKSLTSQRKWFIWREKITTNTTYAMCTPSRRYFAHLCMSLVFHFHFSLHFLQRVPFLVLTCYWCFLDMWLREVWYTEQPIIGIRNEAILYALQDGMSSSYSTVSSLNSLYSSKLTGASISVSHKFRNALNLNSLIMWTRTMMEKPTK